VATVFVVLNLDFRVHVCRREKVMTKEEAIEIYKKLAEPFPEKAVERTKASMTHKGYDTTGIKYQYCVNRLNEVLGVGSFRVCREFFVTEVPSKNGGTRHDVTCDLQIHLGTWCDGKFMPFAEALGTGGHISSNLADARKGAYTNAFKKTVAFFGVGRQAYEGTLDDDNVPAEGETAPTTTRPKDNIDTLALFNAIKTAKTLDDLAGAAAKIGSAVLSEDQLLAARAAYAAKKTELSGGDQ
jgi:hypothetical protein